MTWFGRVGRTRTARQMVSSVRRPPGMCLALLGADGSGKTAVIARLTDYLTRTRRRPPIYLHFRPRLGGAGSNGLPVADPHGRPARGGLLSTVKLLYYLFDFAVGYAWKVWPARLRSDVVIFDRYYDDLLIDPLRYRHGGSRVSLRAVGVLIPQPDMFIVLDAPAAILQARKREVEIGESARAREGYLAFARAVPRAHVVDASRSLDEVFDEVRVLVEAHLRRFGDRAPGE
jgi:thymidylate kinase